MVDMILLNSHLGQTDLNNKRAFWASDMKSAKVNQTLGVIQSEAQLVQS